MKINIFGIINWVCVCRWVGGWLGCYMTLFVLWACLFETEARGKYFSFYLFFFCTNFCTFNAFFFNFSFEYEIPNWEAQQCGGTSTMYKRYSNVIFICVAFVRNVGCCSDEIEVVWMMWLRCGNINDGTIFSSSDNIQLIWSAV